MLGSIRSGLCCLINDIDSGNSELSKQDEETLSGLIRRFANADQPMSKYQAYHFLNVSRATFDRLVKEGKIVSGRKLVGFKEKVWYKKDLLRVNNTRNGDKS